MVDSLLERAAPSPLRERYTLGRVHSDVAEKEVTVRPAHREGGQPRIVGRVLPLVSQFPLLSNAGLDLGTYSAVSAANCSFKSSHNYEEEFSRSVRPLGGAASRLP